MKSFKILLLCRWENRFLLGNILKVSFFPETLAFKIACIMKYHAYYTLFKPVVLNLFFNVRSPFKLREFWLGPLLWIAKENIIIIIIQTWCFSGLPTCTSLASAYVATCHFVRKLSLYRTIWSSWRTVPYLQRVGGGGGLFVFFSPSKTHHAWAKIYPRTT